MSMRSFCPLRGFGCRSGANRRPFWLSQKTVHAPAPANKTVEIRVGSVETAVNRTFGGGPASCASRLRRRGCGPTCPPNDGRLRVADRDLSPKQDLIIGLASVLFPTHSIAISCVHRPRTPPESWPMRSMPSAALQRPQPS